MRTVQLVPEGKGKEEILVKNFLRKLRVYFLNSDRTIDVNVMKLKRSLPQYFRHKIFVRWIRQNIMIWILWSSRYY